MTRIGILGGSGLYDMEALEQVSMKSFDTPFGAPSDDILEARLGGKEVFFLPRHGRTHTLLPSEINHRANIYALKSLGVDCIIAFTAVGSLREDVRPRDILLPLQYFDRTKQNHTFFGNGLVAHVPFGDPVCPVLHEQLVAGTQELVLRDERFSSLQIHADGTYVNMEGPAFSTRAESNAYRAMGFDVIGMTSLPEAKLSREAQMAYAPVALVTDYDCWYSDAEDVHVEMVVENARANIAFAQALLETVVPRLEGPWSKQVTAALDGAIMTAPSAIAPELLRELRPILGDRGLPG